MTTQSSRLISNVHLSSRRLPTPPANTFCFLNYMVFSPIIHFKDFSNLLHEGSQFFRYEFVGQLIPLTKCSSAFQPIFPIKVNPNHTDGKTSVLQVVRWMRWTQDSGGSAATEAGGCCCASVRQMTGRIPSAVPAISRATR